MGHTDRTAQSETSDQSRYVIRAGELAHDSYELDLTPERPAGSGPPCVWWRSPPVEA